jgi:hypothetical protein
MDGWAQTRLRKEKLAKMARGESKITKITDFNSLLEEAENQLDRIAGGATMAEGEVRDDAAFASVDAIAKKIDKVSPPSFTAENATPAFALDAPSDGTTSSHMRLLHRGHPLPSQRCCGGVGGKKNG